MKLFLISQDKNSGNDTYDAAVVAALDEASARQINPGGSPFCGTWCDPAYVMVRYIGEAGEGIELGVLCASFNAG